MPKDTLQSNSRIPKPSRTFSQVLEEQKQAKIAAKNAANNPADHEPEYQKKDKSIKYLVKDGFFTAIKSGFTENFIMAFAIAMNASTGLLSALASVPQLVASFFQLFAQESLAFFKTRKRLIVWTAIMQACMWLPLLLIPFIAREWVWLILVFVTLEVTFGTFQGPIFNSLIGDIVAEDKRGEFFGKRNRVVNLINFVSTFLAGFILTYFTHFDTEGAPKQYVFFGFAILFFIAFIARLAAAYYKTKIYDPPYIPPKHATSFFTFLKSMTHDNYGIFVFYVFLLKFAASISMPFFALYLLKDMGMNYTHFTLVIGGGVVAGFLAMTLWGKLIDRYGSKRVLMISGFLVPFSPIPLIGAVYLKTPTAVFIYILCEEMFAGVAWAGFNLSTSSFLFDATSKEERVKYIAYYNFLVGIAVFLGAVLGGVLIGIFPVWAISAIPFVFLTSGILRLLSTAIMIKKVHEARMVEIHVPGRSFIFNRTVAISPHYGATIEVVGTRPTPKKSKQLWDTKPPKQKTPPINPVKPEERERYEKKSFEYYKKNALDTLSQEEKVFTPKDDSDAIAKDIERDKKKIVEMTEEIKRNQLKK